MPNSQLQIFERPLANYEIFTKVSLNPWTSIPKKFASGRSQISENDYFYSSLLSGSSYKTNRPFLVTSHCDIKRCMIAETFIYPFMPSLRSFLIIASWCYCFLVNDNTVEPWYGLIVCPCWSTNVRHPLLGHCIGVPCRVK